MHWVQQPPHPLGTYHPNATNRDKPNWVIRSVCMEAAPRWACERESAEEVSTRLEAGAYSQGPVLGTGLTVSLTESTV